MLLICGSGPEMLWPHFPPLCSHYH
jgi:hypothetical protein